MTVAASDIVLPVDDAYRLIDRSSRRELTSFLQHRHASADDPAWLMISGTVAHMGGDVKRGVSVLSRAHRRARGDQKAYIADLLGPLYVMLGDAASLCTLLENTAERPAELAATLAALGAVGNSFRGDATYVDVADAYRDAHLGPSARGKLFQRLALAAYHCRHFETALALSEVGALECMRALSYRPLFACHSIAYIINHSASGNVMEALRHGKAMAAAAVQSDDLSFMQLALVAQYEIGAELCDESLLDDCRKQLKLHGLPPQYQERFALRLADFMQLAWTGDFVAFGNGLAATRDGLASTKAQSALCEALIALAAVHSDNTDACRAHSRRALALATIRGTHDEPATEGRYRRLARALAAAACIMIGDAVRGRRAVHAKWTVEDEESRALLAIASGADFQCAPRQVRGYGRIVYAARIGRPVGTSLLSPAEREILQCMVEGLRPPEIARDTGRSVHTIRNHTRAIYQKLNVTNSLAAVAFARRDGPVS